MTLDELQTLAGIKKTPSVENTEGSNISLTGSEKRKIEREKNIKPGTPEWFKLWFSKPYLTGEKPI